MDTGSLSTVDMIQDYRRRRLVVFQSQNRVVFPDLYFSGLPGVPRSYHHGRPDTRKSLRDSLLSKGTERSKNSDRWKGPSAREEERSCRRYRTVKAEYDVVRLWERLGEQV